MRNLGILGLALLVFFFAGALPAQSAGTVSAKVTILVASNEGSDFDMDNDAYRDQLIRLFSFSYYKQVRELSLDLRQGDRQVIELPEGHELVLTLQREENGTVFIQAVIRKERQQFVDTVLSILRKGVVFIGGPKTSKGTLIVGIETGIAG